MIAVPISLTWTAQLRVLEDVKTEPVFGGKTGSVSEPVSEEKPDLVSEVSELVSSMASRHSRLIRCNAMRNAQIALSSGAVAEKMGSWGNKNSTYAGKSAVSNWGSQPSARQAWKTFESGEWEPPFVEIQVSPDTSLNYCKCMTACGKFKCQNRVCPPDPVSGRNFLWCYDCSEGQCECTCKICPKKYGSHRCIWSTSELNPSAPAECSVDLSPALEHIFNILFSHPVVLSRKTCKALCKSFLDRSLFSHNGAFSICHCNNCGRVLTPSVKVCCCGVQRSV